MHLNSRFAALAAAASLVAAGLAGCSSNKSNPPLRENAVLTDREAARLAEVHMDQDANAGPRDIVSITKWHDGEAHLVGFQSFFDETQHPPKASRLVVVDHDGDIREMTFSD